MSDRAPLVELIELNPRHPAARIGDDVSFVAMADVSEDGTLTRVFSRHAAAGYPPFAEGDILMAKITPCMENGKGAHARNLPHPIGQGSTEFHVLRARPGVNDRFVFHLTRTGDIRQRAEAMMTGSAGQRRVPTEFFSRYQVYVPMLEEQRRIAEILDTIDETIQATERVIAKLQRFEEGSATRLLAHAGGTVVSLGSVARLSSGSTPNRERADYWGGDVAWVKTGEVRGNEIASTEERITSRALRECPLRVYPRGTILVAMYGQGNTRGRVGILGLRATTNQACAAVEPDQSVALAQFVFEVLRSSYDKVRSLSQGSHQENLSTSLLSRFEFSLPSFPEQNRVVGELTNIRNRHRGESTSLEKLKRIRAGLAADLLSGRVRTVAS